MKLFRYLVVLGALLIPALALAHGPTRQKITVTQDIAATPEAVWSAIGNFQDMSWHPVVFETNGEGGNAIDATRVLTLGEAGGPTIAEILYKFSDEKMSYSYRITDVAVEVLPVTNYSSHLTVIPYSETPPNPERIRSSSSALILFTSLTGIGQSVPFLPV